MSLHGTIKRLQIPAFGAALRKLLGSPKVSDQKTAGIIVEECNALVACKSAGTRHPREYRLHGPVLEEIGYLRLYFAKQSIRVYFAVIEGTLWMLDVIDKRRDTLSDGEEESLRRAWREAKAVADREHEGSSRDAGPGGKDKSYG